MKAAFSSFFIGTLLCWSLAPPALAADALNRETRTTGPLPTIDQVLDRYVQAIGGKAALQKVTSRQATGVIEGLPLVEGAKWQYLAKVPNKSLSSIEIPALGAMREGFNGTIAWRQSFMGTSEKTGEELAKIKRDADFYRDVKLKSIFPDLTVIGTERIGTEEAYVAETKPTPGSLERFCFSVKTGLLVRQQSSFDMGGGKVETTVDLEDYRSVEGCKVAYKVRLNVSAPGQPSAITIRITEVKFGVPIDDSTFDKPTA